jgi:superfamily II DNA or RNA helicase
MGLRLWQQRAMDEYLASGKQDFLLEATPGAGKTQFSAALARRLIDDGTVDSVIVVVPTDALRLQWCDRVMTIRLRPMDDEIVFKPGYDGVVVTYQQLARGATSNLIRRAISRRRTLGIFDELHHAGAGKSWSEGLTHAFDVAARRLGLTGTPWRRDNRPIPYVTYGDDEMVKVDYHYRYAAAVNDRVCRPIVFHAHNGEARWVDCGEIVEAHVCEDLDEEKTGAALDALYRPEHLWMPAMLAKAAAALDELRQEIPDAGGLVWAEDKYLADMYAGLLCRITGEMPVIVHSGETEQDAKRAKGDIDRFCRGNSRWMVSVRMVSEGVDVPRLLVGVFAAKKLTPLFFRQAVGRIVRLRSDEEPAAQMFIPAVPAIVRHAYEIEQELLHELQQEEEQAQREQKKAEEYQQTLNFRVPLSASEPVFTEAIHRGQGVAPDLLAEAQQKCGQFGINVSNAASIALLLQEERRRPVELTGQVTVQPAPAEPQHRLEKRLRQEVEALARRVDYKHGLDPGTTNLDLLRAGHPKRKLATIDQLQDMRTWLAGRLQ